MPVPPLTVSQGKRTTKLDKSTILYAIVNRKYVEVHVNKDYVFKTSASLMVVEEQLGDGFLRINLSTLAAIRYIREISDKIWLSNGEGLPYVVSNKRRFMKRIVDEKKKMAEHHAGEDIPQTEEEYREYYRGFEHMPFAFADIHVLIGSAFGDLFYNMDSKWLESYERAALYGETLEVLDYSPEIDTNLKVICFQTFVGHCGCILFNVDEMK